MKVSVAYAENSRQSWLNIEVPDGASVKDAIDTSGILGRHRIDLDSQRVGIFGKTAKLDTPLRAGDRVEIYRTITCDPLSVPRRPGFELDKDE
jgi:putative ubiquitin-RnfH superfamily antitoxin RatB of RatAB toxin-antitoxin module